MLFTSADQIMQLLLDLSSKGHFVFRGYEKTAQLLPGLIRYDDLSGKEIQLLSDFERYGLQYFSPSTTFDFLSTAQHFGLPTRLVDFTYNPFIALAFALNNPNAGENYYIRYCDTNQNPVFACLDSSEESNNMDHDSVALRCGKMIAKLENYNEKEMIDFLMRCPKTDGTTLNYSQAKEFTKRLLSGKAILLISPNLANQRIMSQQGLFMYSLSLDKQVHEAAIRSCTKLICINRFFREELIKKLDVLGCNIYKLMPDLMNVCTAIKTNATERNNAHGTFSEKTLACLKTLNEHELKAIASGNISKKELRAKLAGCLPIQNNQVRDRDFVLLVKSLLASKRESEQINLYCAHRKK